MDGRGTVEAAGVREIPGRQTDYRGREEGSRERGAGPGAAAGEYRSPLPAPERREILEPREGVLARRRLYQRGPDRVPPRRIALAAAVPEGPAGRAHALPRRDYGQVLLPKGCPELRPGLDPSRADLERGHATRHRLLPVRQRRVVALHHQHGHDPAARVGDRKSGV